MSGNDKVFVKITNQDIFNKLGDVEILLTKMNGKVATHQKWLTALSGAFGAGFIFILSWILTIK